MRRGFDPAARTSTGQGGAGGEDVEIHGPADNAAGDLGKMLIAAAGVVAEHREGGVDGPAVSFGDHPFGLLDDDAAGERLAELLVDESGVEGGAVLQDGDRGDVGKRSSCGDIVVAQ